MESRVEKGTNPKSVPLAQVKERLFRLLDYFCMHYPSEHIQAIGLGMAGVFHEQEKKHIQHILQDYPVQRPVYITDDAEIAIAAGTGDKYGMVVISGTGSIVYGIAYNGLRFRTGGWGPVLGDFGSGYDIGLKTLQAAMKSYDGVIGPTLLTSLIVKEYGLKTIADLRNIIYTPELGKQSIAAFAKLCIKAAEQEDPTALQIITEVAADLAELTLVLIRKHPDFVQLPIVLHGSIFNHSPLFQNQFIGPIQAKGITNIRLLSCPPAYGASQLARNLLKNC